MSDIERQIDAAFAKSAAEQFDREMLGDTSDGTIGAEALRILGRPEMPREASNANGLHVWPHEHRLAMAVLVRGGEIAKLRNELRMAKAESERLRELLNTPELHDFSKAVALEAAHQRERWEPDHDATKTDADWFWLIGYLAGKALWNPGDDAEKRLHRIITVAAAAANWHAAKLRESGATAP